VVLAFQLYDFYTNQISCPSPFKFALNAIETFSWAILVLQRRYRLPYRKEIRTILLVGQSLCKNHTSMTNGYLAFPRLLLVCILTDLVLQRISSILQSLTLFTVDADNSSTEILSSNRELPLSYWKCFVSEILNGHSVNNANFCFSIKLFE